jgi:hypothetical protein
MIKEMFNDEKIENLVSATQSLKQIRTHYINSIESFGYLKKMWIYNIFHVIPLAITELLTVIAKEAKSRL